MIRFLCTLLLATAAAANAAAGVGSIPAHKTGTTANAASLPDSAAYRPTPKGTAPAAYKGMALVWHDEFDRDGAPDTVWTPETGFVRNKELQWYQPKNAEVKDGCLVITGRQERVPNPNYQEGSASWKTSRPYASLTSASMTTRRSFSFRKGRMEVRAKFPTATGAWPAIWLHGKNWEWPNCGEIDIMEYYLKRGVPSVLANACWGSPQQNIAVWDESVTPLTSFTDSDPEWTNKFHLWRMDWDDHDIFIYLDGRLLNRIELSKTANQGFNHNTHNPYTSSLNSFYIILNLALGSSGGTPDLSAFPLHYYIDYVRVYQ